MHLSVFPPASPKWGRELQREYKGILQQDSPPGLVVSCSQTAFLLLYLIGSGRKGSGECSIGILLGSFDNPDRTKGWFFENAIKCKKLIYCAAHLVATLPIMLGPLPHEWVMRWVRKSNMEQLTCKQSNYRLKFFLMYIPTKSQLNLCIIPAMLWFIRCH